MRAADSRPYDQKTRTCKGGQRVCCGARNLRAALTAASRPRKLHFAPFGALRRTCAHFVARPLPGAPVLLGCSWFPDDRCHTLLLASSAAGGARDRPPLHHIRVGLSYFMEDAAGIEPASPGCAHRASSNARPCHCDALLYPVIRALHSPPCHCEERSDVAI